MVKTSVSQYYKNREIISLEEVAQRITRGFIKGKLKGIPFFNPRGKLIFFLLEEMGTWILGNRQPANYEINEKISKLKIGGNNNVK